MESLINLQTTTCLILSFECYLILSWGRNQSLSKIGFKALFVRLPGSHCWNSKDNFKMIETRENNLMSVGALIASTRPLTLDDRNVNFSNEKMTLDVSLSLSVDQSVGSVGLKDSLGSMKDEMEKVKFNSRKKKPRILKKGESHRPSIASNYSAVSLSDVTEESLEVWRALPEKIRQDPSLASFRKRNEDIKGEKH